MAFLIGVKNKGGNASKSIRNANNLSIRRVESIDYYVLTTPSESGTQATECPGVPRIYQNFNGLYCTNVKAEEVGETANGILWIVTCRFDNQIEYQQNEVEIWWDIEEKDELLKFDPVDNKPIQNSSQEPILTTFPNPIPVLSIRRIEPIFPATKILRYNGHVNQNKWFGAPPGCALMVGPTARRKFVDDQYVWEVLYRVKFNFRTNPKDQQPAGWYLFLLDHGSRTVEDVLDVFGTGDLTYVYKTIVNDEDQEETTRNLNGAGQVLPEAAEEVYLKYNRFPLRDFDELGLFPPASNEDGDPDA